MKATLGLVFAVALAAGCMSTGNFDSLSQADQARFQRCSRRMQGTLCGDDREEFYVVNCIRSSQSTYADQRGDQGRRQWLIEEGCPPAMVNPAPYLAGVPADAPPPRASVAVPVVPTAPASSGQKADSE